MAPSTITETIEHTIKYDTKQIHLTHQTQESNDHDDNHTSKQSLNLTPYDELIGTSEEPKWMQPVRDWERSMGFVTPILWGNTIAITSIHIVTMMWFINHFIFMTYPKWQTFTFGLFMGEVAGFGVTAGVHRYWCHRSYKAKLPLQLILILCYSVAGQNTIFEWVRDHRVHHKFSEMSSDPHDANRGFFFSHVGWLMMKKHPDVIREGRKMDMSDISNDPLVRFHTRHFTLFKLAFCFVLPSLIPWLLWGETLWRATLSQALVRYTLSLNFTWSVNSFAHLWGNKPYDRHIMPRENIAVSIVAMGEGWHNYHHTFPWDYKAAELGMSCNLTTVLLDLFAKVGWAYDLKVASPALVTEVARNRGENSDKLA